MRLDTTLTRGPAVASEWGSEPNMRADIKMDMALALARMMRLHDLIDYVLTTAENGDTIITASVNVTRTGDEH